MRFNLVGVEDLRHLLNLDQRLPGFCHKLLSSNVRNFVVLDFVARYRRYSRRMRSVLSQRDMSERMTVPPSRRPSKIWIEFTDSRPTFTGTRIASLLSASSLNKLMVLFSCLQRQVHQHSVDPRTDFQRIQLLPLQFGKRSCLIDLGLLLRELSFNSLLVDYQSLFFQIVSGSELVSFALGRLVGQPGNHAEVVEGLVRIRLSLCLAVVRSYGCGASSLGHQIAIEPHSQALVLGFRCLQLALCVYGCLLHLGVAHFQKNGVGVHL